MPAIYRQGESGRKPKVGARKIINGKEMMWNGNKYVPAPNHGGKKKTTPKPTQNTPNRPKSATGGRGGSFYTVNGITYDRKTGRPIIVPKNRQPVKAKDNTKKDPSAPPSGSNTTPPRPPRNNNTSSTPSRRNGAGVKTPLSGGAGGTRPTGTREKEAKAKTVADRKKYLQTKKGGSLSKRLAAALADKDALKWKG